MFRHTRGRHARKASCALRKPPCWLSLRSGQVSMHMDVPVPRICTWMYTDRGTQDVWERSAWKSESGRYRQGELMRSIKRGCHGARHGLHSKKRMVWTAQLVSVSGFKSTTVLNWSRPPRPLDAISWPSRSFSPKTVGFQYQRIGHLISSGDKRPVPFSSSYHSACHASPIRKGVPGETWFTANLTGVSLGDRSARDLARPCRAHTMQVVLGQ